jgi:hypothetical protein
MKKFLFLAAIVDAGYAGMAGNGFSAETLRARWLSFNESSATCSPDDCRPSRGFSPQSEARKVCRGPARYLISEASLWQAG